MSYEDVRKLVSIGCQVTPIKSMSKRPMLSGWTDRYLDKDQLRYHFDGTKKVNIGVVLGEASKGIIDVDLDNDLAALMAHNILPATDMIFGRSSRPASHYVYRVPDPEGHVELTHPVSGKVIVEVRGNRHQTVFPPSTHPDGEEVCFEIGKDGNPGPSNWNTLVQRCEYLSVATLLCESWNDGSRHKLSLAFSGFCAANHVPQAVCETIIKSVCLVSDDEELDDRMECVIDSYEKHCQNQKLSGISKLNDILGDKVSGEISKWMGVKKFDLTAVAPVSLSPMSVDLSTDLSASESFCETMRGGLLYSGRDACFYRRDSGVYEAICQEQALQSVIGFVKEQTRNPSSYQEQQAHKAMQSNARLNAILNLARSKLFVDATLFDSDPLLVGCANGVLTSKPDSWSRRIQS